MSVVQPTQTKVSTNSTNILLAVHFLVGAAALGLIIMDRTDPDDDIASQPTKGKAYHAATVVGASVVSFGLSKVVSSRADSVYTQLTPLLATGTLGTLLSVYLQNRYVYEGSTLSGTQTLRALLVATFDTGIVYSASKHAIFGGAPRALSMGVLNILMHLIYSSTLTTQYVLVPREDGTSEAAFLSLTMGTITLYSLLAMQASTPVDKQMKQRLFVMALTILAFANGSGLSTPTEIDDVFDADQMTSPIWMYAAFGLCTAIVLSSSYLARPMAKPKPTAPRAPAAA